MTHFQYLVSRLVRQPAVAITVIPQVNREHERILRAHSKAYWTVAGARLMTLDKVEVSPVSGRTVGYFSIVCNDPISRVRHRYAWRYGVHGGQAVEEKAFPVKVG